MTFGEWDSQDCVFCRSKRTVVRRKVVNGMVVHERYCHGCRRDVYLWGGSHEEELRRERAKKKNQNMLKRAATRFLLDGGAPD
jgi:hypothetical protein